ncbi:MAG: bacteriohemerythrin [Candidatus Omnitrophota bacterium]
MIFEWKAEYNVNVKMIDDQHHRLVELLNQLHTFINEGAPEEKSWGRLVKELFDYTLYHFKEEEALMRRHSFDDCQEHMAEHAFFVTRIKSAQDGVEADDLNVMADLQYFLTVWLQNHILIVDHKLCAFLNKKGIY